MFGCTASLLAEFDWPIWSSLLTLKQKMKATAVQPWSKEIKETALTLKQRIKPTAVTYNSVLKKIVGPESGVSTHIADFVVLRSHGTTPVHTGRYYVVVESHTLGEDQESDVQVVEVIHTDISRGLHDLLHLSIEIMSVPTIITTYHWDLQILPNNFQLNANFSFKSSLLG